MSQTNKAQADAVLAAINDALDRIAKDHELTSLYTSGASYRTDGNFTITVQGVTAGGKSKQDVKAEQEYDYIRSTQKEFPARGTRVTAPDGKEYVITGMKAPGRNGRFTLCFTDLAGKPLEWKHQLPQRKTGPNGEHVLEAGRRRPGDQNSGIFVTGKDGKVSLNRAHA